MLSAPHARMKQDDMPSCHRRELHGLEIVRTFLTLVEVQQDPPGRASHFVNAKMKSQDTGIDKTLTYNSLGRLNPDFEETPVALSGR